MRVLVTGASGHVGGAVATHLAARGYQVVGLSRRTAVVPEMAEHVSADLADPNFVSVVSSAVQPCDAVVHAGACLDKRSTAVELSRVNAVGTQQLLVLARDWAVSRVVYISGVPVIGLPRVHPVTEAHHCEPLTVYHASKLYGEHLVRLMAEKLQTVVTLRLPSPIGPGTPQNRIAQVFVNRACQGLPLEIMGAGLRQQNYVDVRDVGRAVEAALTRSVQGVFQIIGTTISNLELAHRCVRLFRSVSTIEFTGRFDPEETVVWDLSGERAAAALEYSPSLSLDDSLLSMRAK